MADSSYQIFSNNDTGQTPKDVKLADNLDTTYSLSIDQIMRKTISSDYKSLSSLDSIETAANIGFLSDCIVINKFARANLSNGTLSLGASFPNVNPYLDTPTSVYLLSDNVADAQNVLIKYIDLNYDMKEITTTLNGQTSVLIGNDIHCIWRMENDSAVDFAGEIYATTSTTLAGIVNTADTSNVYCHIPITSGISANQSLTSAFTIPRNYSAIIYNSYVETQKGTDVLAGGFAKQFGKTFKYKLGMSSFESTASHIGYSTFAGEKTDIKILAIAQTGGIAYFEYNILLIENASLV